MVVRRQAVRMPAGTLALVGPDCPFGWKGAGVGAVEVPDVDVARLRRRGGAARPVRRRTSSRPLGAARTHSRSCSCTTCAGAKCCGPPGPDAAYLEGCRILFDATIQRELLDRREPRAATPSDAVALARAWMRRAPRQPRTDRAAVRLPQRVAVDALSRLRRGEGVSPLACFHESRMERPRPAGDEPRCRSRRLRTRSATSTPTTSVARISGAASRHAADRRATATSASGTTATRTQDSCQCCHCPDSWLLACSRP